MGWHIHVDVPTQELMEVEVKAWIAVSVSGWPLSSQVGF